MPDCFSEIARARIASGLTADDARKAMGLSSSDYERFEQHPLGFSMGEMRSLVAELNEDGKAVLQEWLLSFFGL